MTALVRPVIEHATAAWYGEHGTTGFSLYAANWETSRMLTILSGDGAPFGSAVISRRVRDELDRRSQPVFALMALLHARCAAMLGPNRRLRALDYRSGAGFTLKIADADADAAHFFTYAQGSGELRHVSSFPIRAPVPDGLVPAAIATILDAAIEIDDLLPGVGDEV